MSSDADYAAFFDKANQDTAPAQAQGSSKREYGTKSVDTAVPKVLESVEEYYTSDADEPFEPVSLKFEGKSIDAGELKKLLGGSNHVEEVNASKLEGQYKKVFDAVKEAGSGGVQVFRVELSRTRSEYYVLSLDNKEGRVVGLKALAVES